MDANPYRHSHLHTDECNKIWREYDQCVQRAGFLKYFDICVKERMSMHWCFKSERKQKALDNHKLARKQRQEHVKRLIENTNVDLEE